MQKMSKAEAIEGSWNRLGFEASEKDAEAMLSFLEREGWTRESFGEISEALWASGLKYCQ